MQYIPGYLDAIQCDLRETIRHAENAADYLEKSEPYNNHLHPYHAASVATYNRLVSVLIDFEKLIINTGESINE